jgi:oxaloacetate decarboxylase (Na+ extruding) subunit alpha
MNEIYFVDTTFRDGHASLWAEGMTTGMMLPIASRMDQIGFKSMDFIATSHFLKCVRELREDPWERIRLISKKITKTSLTLMMGHSIKTFELTPFSVIKLWMERIVANGIKRVQLMDASNDLSFRIPECVQLAKDAGLEVAMALIYSYSPRHTDEHYAQGTRDAVKLNVDVIYLKDSGGLLTPERVQTLIPTILKNSNGIPVELHSHCTTGLAPLVYLEAVKLGIKTLHTAIPPLANGSSQPSVLNILRNLRFLGYTSTIDEEAIKPISDHFRYIAKRERLPIGSPIEYDYYQYMHQVPGGVISNLKHQLSGLKMGHQLEEVLKEVVQIRKELGYPIMVTPFSQFVVSQAAMNIMVGERYKRVSDEVIKYTLGFWGKEASSLVDPNIKDKILSLPRAKELLNWEPPQPSLREIREKLGGLGVSDDELLLRFLIQEEEIKAMRSVLGPVKEYFTARNPVVVLIHELCKQKNSNYISIQKKDFSLTLQKKAEA